MNWGVHWGQNLSWIRLSFLTVRMEARREEVGGGIGGRYWAPRFHSWSGSSVPPSFPRDWPTPGILSQPGVSRPPSLWLCSTFWMCFCVGKQVAYLPWFQYFFLFVGFLYSLNVAALWFQFSLKLGVLNWKLIERYDVSKDRKLRTQIEFFFHSGKRNLRYEMGVFKCSSAFSIFRSVLYVPVPRELWHVKGYTIVPKVKEL